MSPAGAIAGRRMAWETSFWPSTRQIASWSVLEKRSPYIHKVNFPYVSS